MITRIEATQYRCFDRLDVDLGESGVIVGANGAGKTTFLDIPTLLADLLSAKRLSAAFLQASGTRAPRAGTPRELLHQGQGDSFGFAIEARLPEHLIERLSTVATGRRTECRPAYARYELRLEIVQDRDIRVRNEYLFTFPEQDRPARDESGRGPRLHGEVDPHPAWRFILKRGFEGDSVFTAETDASTGVTAASVAPERLALPRVQFEGREDFPVSRWLLDLLTEQALFFAPDWSALRAASPPGQPKRLMADGRNLPWLVLGLAQADPDRFESWKEHVAVALPQITDIEALEREEDHHAYLRLTYNRGYQVTSSGLSEGTLRILALTLIPYLPDLPRLLIVEEPENGIHPRAIETVLQSLASVYDSQVLLSSHSPVVVAQTPIEQLLAARLDETGKVTIVPGPKHPRLADWKGQLDLGRLFAAGVLG
jgi:predicted ATPase